MKIKYHRRFLKNYRQRIRRHPKLVKQFEKRLRLRLKEPHHALLHDHRLVGQKSEYRAFSISGDIRVVYKIINSTFFLYDIGTHNQVYER